jgi:hypothetical protein
MTVPVERTNAVINTEKFLHSLLDRNATPRVPKSIREQASRLLRHYPGEYYMNVIADREDAMDQNKISLKVFGKGYS